MFRLRKMNLENNLYSRIESTNRRKRGIIQLRYHCINIKFFDDEGNNLLLGSGLGTKSEYKCEETWWESSRRLEAQYKEQDSSTKPCSINEMTKLTAPEDEEKPSPSIKPWIAPQIDLLSPKPIGSISNLNSGSYGNLFEEVNLGRIFPKDRDAQGLILQSRDDFAERNNEKPILILGLQKAKKKDIFRLAICIELVFLIMMMKRRTEIYSLEDYKNEKRLIILRNYISRLIKD